MDSNTKPKTSQLASQQQDRPPQQDQEEKKSQKPLIKPLLPGRANEPGSEASPAVISSDPVSDKDAAQVINTVSAAMAIPPVPKPPHTGPANPNQHVPDPLAHFLSIPWTAALLTDPGVLAIQVPDRRPLVSGGFRMMRKALNGPRTVRACVTFVTNPQREEQDSGEGRGLSYLLSGGGPEDGEDPARPFVLFHVLLDLGEDVCSYPGVMHGGAVSLMLDEAMASAADTQSS
ncbi:hypothetical protein VTJ04DRAFT_4696 [Mycothermus thermophilus]|uniref:uncharacterized protein n=1 Tax=Humicola insolens TaxID=85995 RepID=UPI0037443F69